MLDDATELTDIALHLHKRAKETGDKELEKLMSVIWHQLDAALGKLRSAMKTMEVISSPDYPRFIIGKRMLEMSSDLVEAHDYLTRLEVVPENKLGD